MSMLRRIAALLNHLGGQFLYEAMIRTLRGSLFIGGAAVVLTSTGAWKYLLSSFAAHDFVQASRLSVAAGPLPSVATVLIDDRGYRDYFGERSPLDRQRLLKLMQTIDAATPRARAIVVDLDLAPLPGHAQRALLDFLTRHRARWVIAAPELTAMPASPGRAYWRRALCHAGVRMGWPYIPYDFGYASTAFQFRGSLSQAAIDPAFHCDNLGSTLLRGRTGPGALRRVSVPMAPQYLRDGLVLPFGGDLGQLRALLLATSPRWVVLGGSWGKSDLQSTPLGRRYGAQLHAAAIAGHLQGERMAPLGLQILVTWLFLACVDVVIGLLYMAVERSLLSWSLLYAGHRFIVQRIWPLVLVAVVVASVLLASDASAELRVHTGYWIPSAVLGGGAIVHLVFVWNWGLNKMVRYDSVGAAWHQVVVVPIQGDWKAARHALHLLRNHSRRTPVDGELSAPRAVFELVAALSSLLIQTGLPLLAFSSALH